MSSASKVLPFYTYEEYCQWEGKWELIDGIPYAMSPSPRPEHQAVAGNLHAEFRSALKTASCNCKVYQPLDYKISEHTVLNSDLLLVCKPITKAFLDFTPELVVEILLPATALKDRHTKFEIYREQKIPFYLIVDVEQQSIEAYKFSAEAAYEPILFEMENELVFLCPACSFSITFENIWN